MQKTPARSILSTETPEDGSSVKVKTTRKKKSGQPAKKKETSERTPEGGAEQSEGTSKGPAVMKTRGRKIATPSGPTPSEVPAKKKRRRGNPEVCFVFN